MSFLQCICFILIRKILSTPTELDMEIIEAVEAFNPSSLNSFDGFRRNGYTLYWPVGYSYLKWQKLLTRYLSYLHFQSKNKSKIKSKKKRQQTHKNKSTTSRNAGTSLRKCRSKRLRKKEEKRIPKCQKVEAIKALAQLEKGGKNGKKPQLALITLLKTFLSQKGLPDLIKKYIPDGRSQKKVYYPSQTLILAALSIFFLRMTSGNRYDQKSHDSDEDYSQENMATFIDSIGDRAPVIKTIEDFLKTCSYESFNEIMIDFFDSLKKNKFFAHHKTLLPKNYFHIACDCVHTHTYDHPHHSNECPYCLKRVYNKGTEKEKTTWQHNLFAVVLVCPGGLKIPIYIYPIRAKQAEKYESESNDVHKQECELIALKKVLPIIRERFPRMKFTVLLDGLYANSPTVNLLRKLNMEYFIVRKKGSLKLLGEDCEGLSKDKNHKKNCRYKLSFKEKNREISQEFEWFNKVELSDGTKVNVLTLFEKEFNQDGKVIREYYCEWLSSKLISAVSCVDFSERARLRWEEEDVFNTLKNRGFCLKHDFSRSPESMMCWQAMMFLSFGLIELFRFSEKVAERTKKLSIQAFVEKLEGQLFFKPPDKIFSPGQLNQRVQFRYNFQIKLKSG